MTEESFDIRMAGLLQRMEAGWTALQQFMDSVSDAQFNGPSDAAGWTIQDHLLHLSDWAEGVVALFDGQDRREAMGIDQAVWDAKDFDSINETLRQRHRFMGYTRQEVEERLHHVHRDLLERLERLTDTDLRAPYPNPDPGAEHPEDTWIVWLLAGDGYEHYEEHLPWMQAILDGSS